MISRCCFRIRHIQDYIKIIISLLVLCYNTVPALAQTKKIESKEWSNYSLLYSRDGSDVQEDYTNNSAQMDQIKAFLAKHRYIDSIVIYAYSSPEGNRKYNLKLSQKRAESAKDFILANLPDNSSFSPENIKMYPMGEDWDGLYNELDEKYHRSNRDRVMKILTADIPADTKKWRLGRLDRGYTFGYIIRNHMGTLRKATLIRFYTPKGDTIPTIDLATEKIKESIAIQQDPIDPFAVTTIQDSNNNKTQKGFKWALKTNLLYDAALTPNIGVEFYLGGNVSINATWQYAWWNTKSWYWRNYGGEIAARLWFGKRAKQKALTGHHLGVYAQAISYDFMVGNKGYMSGYPGASLFDKPSWAVGLEYGYSVPVGKRLNIDFVIGVGYLSGARNEYSLIDDCYVAKDYKDNGVFLPTKAEISLVWLLGKSNKNLGKGGKR